MTDKLFYQSGTLYCLCEAERRQYFYEDGTLKTVELYRDGKREGEVLLYWPNGQIKRRCFFEKGVRHGVDQMWNSEGQLVDEGQYERGKPVGKHCRYGKRGQLIEEVVYLEAPRFNLRQWDEQGKLSVEALWSDDLFYKERVWDRFEKIWREKEGRWDGKKLVYV